MDLEKTRLSPFPFPKHLAQFLVNQLDSPVEDINGTQAKAIHIDRRRAIGKYIIKCLETSSRPIKVEKGITLYVATSYRVSANEKNAPDARYTDVFLSEKSINEIKEIFEDFMRAEFISFIDGVDFGNEYRKSKQGKFSSGVYAFLEKYSIDNDGKSFDRFKKMYQRSKKQGNTPLNKVV